MTQSVNEQVGTIPAVEAEAHFVKIGLQMLGANLVPRSDDAALEQREGILCRVRMNIGSNPDVFSSTVVYLLMGRGHVGFTHGRAIDVEVIGHNHVNGLRYVLAEVLCQCSRLHVLCVEETKSTTALSDADYDLFVGSTATLMDALSASLASNIGFVHFDSTVQHGAVNLCHSSTDAMTEIPCSFVANSERPLDLICTHPLARFYEQHHSEEPCFQRKVRVVEDCAGGHCELVLAVGAPQEFLIRADARERLSMAAWTFRPDWPAETFQERSEERRVG